MAVCPLAACLAGESGAPTDLSALKLFSDPAAGYSIRLPAGYERLSEEENRERDSGLSELFARNPSEHAQLQPSIYFKGPQDPKRPKLPPPVFVMSYYDSDQAIDPKELPHYQQLIEQNYRKKGDRYSDLRLTVVQVNGLDALKVENDLINLINNSRDKVIRVRIPVPANSRHYEIFFNFSPNQNDEVQAALAVLLQSFKSQPLPLLDPAAERKWTRILFWTVGSGAAGMLIYWLFFLLTRRTKKA
jgi:hypothetical protein